VTRLLSHLLDLLMDSLYSKLCSKFSKFCSKFCSKSSTHEGGHTVLGQGDEAGHPNPPNPSDARLAAVKAAEQRRMQVKGFFQS
jgi:hypothetical protein